MVHKERKPKITNLERKTQVSLEKEFTVLLQINPPLMEPFRR